MSELVVTRESIGWAFRLILGREPSTSDIEHFLDVERISDLREIFLSSFEFRLQNIGPLSAEAWVIAQIHKGTAKAWVNCADRVVSYGMLYDNYEPEVTAFLGEILEEGHAALDIGACLGWHTLGMASSVGPRGRVVSFEANPSTSHHLRETVALNPHLRNIEIESVALGSVNSEGSISRADGDFNLGNYAMVPTSDSRSGFQIQIRKLDDFEIARCDVIKIDVEGYEPHVIRGGADLIAGQKPIIVSEIYDQQMRSVGGCGARDYVNQIYDLGYRAYSLSRESMLKPYEKSELWGITQNHDVVFWPDGRDGEFSMIKDRILSKVSSN